MNELRDNGSQNVRQWSSGSGSTSAQPEGEAAYVGKPPSYLVGSVFKPFVIGYLLIIVVVRTTGSNGLRIIPHSLEPAARDFVSFVFPAFKIQYEQLASLANESVQSQFLTIIFFAVVFGCGLMILCAAKYWRVWQRLAAPSWRFGFTILIMPPLIYSILVQEKFKPAMDSLTALFFDDGFGWFYFRQTALVYLVQIATVSIVLSVAQIVLMRVRHLKNNATRQGTKQAEG